MDTKARKITVRSFLIAMFWSLSYEIVAAFGAFLIFFAITKLVYAKFLLIYFVDVFWIVWLSTSILAGLIYFFANIYRYINKGVVFQPAPMLPSLILGVAFILIEILISVFTLSVLIKFYALSSLSVLLVIAVIDLLLEMARRYSSILIGFKNISLKISSFIKQVAENIKKFRLFIVYWALNLIFAVLACVLIYKGYISPLDNQPIFANELFSNVLTIVTGILAIFFAGATLIMQLIIGTYSYKFVEALFRNSIFVSSFLIYLLVAIAHLVFLRIVALLLQFIYYCLL